MLFFLLKTHFAANILKNRVFALLLVYLFIYLHFFFLYFIFHSTFRVFAAKCVLNRKIESIDHTIPQIEFLTYHCQTMIGQSMDAKQHVYYHYSNGLISDIRVQSAQDKFYGDHCI